MENSDAGSYVCTVSGESVSVMSDTATLIYYGMTYVYVYIFFIYLFNLIKFLGCLMNAFEPSTGHNM